MYRLVCLLKENQLTTPLMTIKVSDSLIMQEIIFTDCFIFNVVCCSFNHFYLTLQGNNLRTNSACSVYPF